MFRALIVIGLMTATLAGCQTRRGVIEDSAISSFDAGNVHTANATIQTVGFDSNVIESPQVDGPHSIDEYVAIGLTRNPRIAEAEHTIAAISHRLPQVSSLPDPMVNTTTYLSPVQTAAGEQRFALGVSQKIVSSQRRDTQALIVAEEVEAARADLETVRNEINEDIRVVCHQLRFIREAIEITEEDIKSLARILVVVEQQYEVKKSVTQQDVLNVHVEQSNIENELTRLQQTERSYRARLARLLHVDQRSVLRLAAAKSSTMESFDLDSLIQTAMQLRPELRAQLAAIRRGQHNVDLARLERRPDFTVGVNWISTSSEGISPVANGDDAVLLGVGFNLPVRQNRNEAKVCEATANNLASVNRFEVLQDSVAEEVFDLVAKAESVRETLGLLREDIIPKSERSLDLSIAEYTNGKIEYVQLIENWRKLLRYRIAEARMHSELQQHLASLYRSIGCPDLTQIEPVNPESIEDSKE